jgi:inositol phosphorylceramide mannosyltransferase catalytic subunit
MIPKVVYQTWYTREFPPPIQEKRDAMMKLNPDYTFILYTDDEMDVFVNENYPGVIADCYNKLNIIVAKADFWRYLILYKYGGIYLDIDSSIEKPLRDLIQEEDRAILSAEQNEFKFVQWCLLFEKEHLILQKTIDFVVENIQNNLFPNDICKMTGPVVFTKGVLYTHYELFGEILDNRTFTHTTKLTFQKDSVSYRVLGIDYHPYFCFKYEECYMLYIHKNHWHYEEAQIDLLKSNSL